MRLFRSKFVAIVIIACIAIFGFGVWHIVFHRYHQGQGETSVRYTCPMHPSYISDRPGECPICGMTLVPMKEEGKKSQSENGGMKMEMPIEGEDSTDKGARAEVSIDSKRQQLIGVTTANIAKGPAMRTVRALGRVAYDPDLTIAQREYIEAKRVGDGQIVKAAKQRLLLMGMSDEQINELSHQGKPDKSLVLPEGSAWIYATIYEREFPHMRAGQSAAIELPDGTNAGSGIVRAIDPVLDPMTRSARARIETSNPQRLLHPNMFVTVTLHEDLGEKITVPKSAVIDSGKRKLVFIVHDGEHFIPRSVVLGPELADSFVIESGIDVGDMVATSALFLIDSESQLKAAAGSMGGHKHD